MQTQELTQVRSLGEGGFGTTTLVERDGKRYVLKRLKQSAIADHGQTAIDLFVKESEYLKTLGDNSQIPALIDSGVDGNGPWLLQEYIPGDNLETILAQQSSFSEAEIIALLKSILPVLGAVHQSGAIHRDVKPANIIFSGDRYYLVDFGASKRVSETVLAKTGTMIGTAMYTAPEQLVGRATFASDIYSLGVTCIRLLTGLQPMELIDRMEAGRWCWRDFLPKERSVSEGLGLILDRMLEYGVHRRYASAEEVLVAINNIGRMTIRRQRLARIEEVRQKRIVLGGLLEAGRFSLDVLRMTGKVIAFVCVGSLLVWGIVNLPSLVIHFAQTIHLPSSFPLSGQNQLPEIIVIRQITPIIALIAVLGSLFAIIWAGIEIIGNGQPMTFLIKPGLFVFLLFFLFYLFFLLLQ